MPAEILVEFCFAEAAEPLGWLKAQVAAGGKLSRTNEGERWAGEINSQLKRDHFGRMSMKGIAMVGSKLIQCH